MRKRLQRGVIELERAEKPEHLRPSGRARPAGSPLEQSKAGAQRPEQVLALQRLAGNKAVTALLSAGPTPVQRVGTIITSPAMAGTSIHPVLSKSATDNNVTAVIELQQKLGSILGAKARLALNVEGGRFGLATETFLKGYQKSKGLPESGVADAAIWSHLDAEGKSKVGRVERTWDQELDYGHTGMTSRYNWEIEDNRIVVRVGINFIAHPTNPPPNLSAKVARIKRMCLDTWNRFQAVRTDATAPARPIVFEIVDSGGTTVNVVNGDGQSDANNWFWGDVVDLPNVPAHEFGHLIGLEDEYQRFEAPYKRLFPDRSDTEVNADKLTNPSGQEIFTSNTSLMGLGSITVSAHPDKVNPPEPRHVREFVGYLEKAVGGVWEARAR